MWSEELVNELVHASYFLSETLNNTLDMTKLEEGKTIFNKNYDSIRNVIDMVLKMNKPNSNKKGIKLSTEYVNYLPPLMEFDKFRMTQISMNLVGNAVKFTPEKGKITIKIKWQPKILGRERLFSGNYSFKKIESTYHNEIEEIKENAIIEEGGEVIFKII